MKSGSWPKNAGLQSCGYGTWHFKWIRIPWYGYGSGSRFNTDPGFWWPKIEEKIQLKFLSFFQTLQSLGLHIGRPSYRRRLQPSKENIQYLKKWNLLTFLLFLWVIFAHLDLDHIANPDPDLDPETPLNPDPQQCGSQLSKTLFKLEKLPC